MPTPLPSLEYLLECSEQSLADLELACLNRSQQCLRTARFEWEEAVAQRECAGVARWLIDNRRALLDAAHATLGGRQITLVFPGMKKIA